MWITEGTCIMGPHSYNHEVITSTSNHLSIIAQTFSCSSLHSLCFSSTHVEQSPRLIQSKPLIRSSVSIGLYTPPVSMAGEMTEVIQVSANTSVHAIWGVVAGVKSIGVKWSITLVIRLLHKLTSESANWGSFSVLKGDAGRTLTNE